MSQSNDVLGAQILSAGRILQAEHKGQTGFKFSRRRLVIKVKKENVALEHVPNFDENVTTALTALVASGSLRETGRMYELDEGAGEGRQEEVDDGNLSPLTSLSSSDTESTAPSPKRKKKKARSTTFLGVYIAPRKARTAIEEQAPHPPPSVSSSENTNKENEEKEEGEKIQEADEEEEDQSRTIRGSSIATSATLTSVLGNVETKDTFGNRGSA